MEPSTDRDVTSAALRASDHAPQQIAADLAYLRTAIVNVFFYGPPDAGDRGWVLIDAGIPGAASRIVDAAAARFGWGARPSAIILTHGHFDHVGALKELARKWEAPVYAHPLELPYLTGRSAYPPPDPTVGGGAMARMAALYPRGPIYVGPRLEELPADESVPGMDGWRWVHTPGHTAGHVSLFRESDRALIAGDAVVTTKQESMLSVLAQRPEVHGPPMYFTQDWGAAGASAAALAALEPQLLATGHGPPMRGAESLAALHDLAANFRERAVPRRGRYVDGGPAVADETGVVSVPPEVDDALPRILLGVGVAAVAGVVLRRVLARRSDAFDDRFSDY
ncbi:MAG: Probable metallo-hydrolase YflN [uncultured Gemmatimonadaceae bacterium]|uniref:Probable metallo-hydrolase YflN n=1 Tax=uncultured Gemmatimonadaceae bacterium TaxID=246130 RepID=A0A6J4KID6_9BACT|nr:MAG: Probable metallo-hydrolase YflN [uncultured Gemmatimonadaceae bacterium]